MEERIFKGRECFGQSKCDMPFELPIKWLPKVYRHMFNYRGRTSPIQHAIDWIVMVLVTITVSAVVVALKTPPELMNILKYIIVIVDMTAIGASMSRRCRDAGYPAYSWIVILIPVVGIVWAAYKLSRPRDFDAYQRDHYYSQEQMIREYEKKRYSQNNRY